MNSNRYWPIQTKPLCRVTTFSLVLASAIALTACLAGCGVEQKSVPPPRRGELLLKSGSFKHGAAYGLMTRSWLFGKDNKIRQDIFDEYTHRVGALSRTNIVEFGTALAEISGDDLNLEQTVEFMIQTETFFDKDGVRQAEIDADIQKLRNVSYHKIETLVRKGATPPQAALYCVFKKKYRHVGAESKWNTKLEDQPNL